MATVVNYYCDIVISIHKYIKSLVNKIFQDFILVFTFQNMKAPRINPILFAKTSKKSACLDATNRCCDTSISMP